jgi:hypothetical protein
MKTTFPKDPGRALRKMDILIELEAALSDKCKSSIIGVAFWNGLQKEGPKDSLLDAIRSAAADNYWVVADIIGYKLLDKIIAFK